MKRLFKLILVMLIISNHLKLVASIGLESALHKPRFGDLLEMKKMLGVNSGMLLSDTTVYDFSECRFGGLYQIRYSSYGDTLLSINENRKLSIYCIDGDSMKLVSCRAPGLKLVYYEPEIDIIYGVHDVVKSSGYYYAEGQEGTSDYVRHSGKYMFTLAHVREVKTPQGNVIQNMIMTTYKRVGAVIHLYYSPSFVDSRIKTPVTSGEIERHLANDTITLETMRRCWYQHGYRYPIVDIRYYKLFLHREPIDSSITALYYDGSVQEIAIENDPINELIRLKCKYDFNEDFVSRGNNCLLSDWQSKRIDMSYDLMAVGKDEWGVLSKCDLNPLVVSKTATLAYQTIQKGIIDVYVFSTNGVLIEKESITIDEKVGTHICNFSNLISGEYVVVVVFPDKTFTYKIIKNG